MPAEKPSSQRVGLLIVTAMEVELAPIRTRLKLDKADRHLEGTVHGLTVVAARTGMGEVAGDRCRDLIKTHQPRQIILAGFAGGLDDGFKLGQIIVPDYVIRTFGQAIDVSNGVPQKHPRADGQTEDEVRARTMLTADALASTAEQKRTMSRQHQAGTVDLEAYHIANVASDMNVPLTVIKALTDTSSEAMPPWMGGFVNDDGTTATTKAAIHAMTHPWRIAAMSKLAGASKTAGQQLAVAVDKRIAKIAHDRDARRRR